MSHKQPYAIPAAFARNAYLNTEQYKALYYRSIVDPASFWDEQAKQFVTWFEPWQQTTQGDFTNLDLHWFKGGKLNVSYNCLDRHLTNYAEQIAIIWEGDEPNQTRTITYKQLHTEVCRFANVLKKYGIKKGDRVCIYLPMIPEIAVAMLACVRIGAIHSVVFAGFSAASLKTRILDADCRLLITADEGVRGGKPILLKNNADAALADCPNVKQVIVVKRTGNEINWQRNRDVWYHEVIEESSTECHAEMMDAEDPLFILYTSGSTGKPKGILHATGGYLVYAAMSFHYTFDYHAPDVFWCTADLGWITGHSYLLYGPLANHATTLMFEGVPHYPNFSRLWNIIDKHRVNIFYTAPTAIRALRKEGDEWVTATQRTSLKLLGTVGEPINSEVWEWYYHVVGEERCPIVDTWWQTETGGMLITPLPGVTPLKPGSPSWPFFGIVPEVVDDNGNKLPPNTQGNLVIKQPWPGLMSTIYKDQERFINNYFKPISGNYFTGDSAYYDEDGYFWIVGRNDDVIKISGHRIGTGEVESAIVSHPAVAEAAVVGIPDDIKGQTIYAFVTPNANISPNDQLTQEVVQQVRNVIGAIATPKLIQWTNALPKTRSGKIMRRILRKIACNDLEDFGDTSTLLDPGVIEELIRGKK